MEKEPLKTTGRDAGGRLHADKKAVEYEHLAAISCYTCGNDYSLTVNTNGSGLIADSRPICCIFCGQPTKPKIQHTISSVSPANHLKGQPLP